MSEDKIPNDSQEETEISENESKITIKKSTYNKMLVAIVGIVAIAAFFGGYSIGSFDDSGLTGEQLKEILSEIKTASTPQPIQSPQPSAPQIFTVSIDDDPVKGNPDALVTVVDAVLISESISFNCSSVRPESSNVPMEYPPKKAAITTTPTIAINILVYVDFFIVILDSFPLISVFFFFRVIRDFVFRHFRLETKGCSYLHFAILHLIRTVNPENS